MTSPIRATADQAPLRSRGSHAPVPGMQPSDTRRANMLQGRHVSYRTALCGDIGWQTPMGLCGSMLRNSQCQLIVLSSISCSRRIAQCAWQSIVRACCATLQSLAAAPCGSTGKCKLCWPLPCSTRWMCIDSSHRNSLSLRSSGMLMNYRQMLSPLAGGCSIWACRPAGTRCCTRLWSVSVVRSLRLSQEAACGDESPTTRYAPGSRN